MRSLGRSLPLCFPSNTARAQTHSHSGTHARTPLARVQTCDSSRASIMTDGTDFSTSSTINRGYAARIDVGGKVRPLVSTPDRLSCQTIAFLEGPSDFLDYKTYRPGDEIKGAVHLLRDDPERGYITGIKARIRGDLETSVLGVGDSSYYSDQYEHGIARRQLLFFSEQKTLATKADLDTGAFALQQTGLVDHGRRNNLAVPFSFVLPLKLQASALDLLDSKFKKSYKRGKKYIDLPPSIDMETRYAPPRPHQLFGHVKEKLHGQKLRPMARIKYEIDIIVSRQRLGSGFLPPKRGERIILSFAVEPYPPRTAGLPVPNVERIIARRTPSRDSRVSADSNRSANTANTNEEEEEEDSWVSNLGGYRQTQEYFGAIPGEEPPALTRAPSSRSVVTRPSLPGCRRKSFISVKEGLDGRMKGWLTHTLETDLGGNHGSLEAVLSVPAMAALYMETKIPFSIELRLPEHLDAGYQPDIELNLVRSVTTFSRLGTLVIEKEDPDNLANFGGPHSWSERIRLVDLERQSHAHLPPFYERGRSRQMYIGHFAIGRYEKMLKAGSSAPYKQKILQEPELRLVVPSFSFKALRIEYRLHVKVSLPIQRAESSTRGRHSPLPGREWLVIETPPVYVAANPDTVDFSRHPGETPIGDGLSTIDVLDEEEERIVSSGEARQVAGPAMAATVPAADVRTEIIDDEHGMDEDFSAQATPLARTPRRRSLDLSSLASLVSPSSFGQPQHSGRTSPLDRMADATMLSDTASSILEMPSLDPIPDEADVDEEDELTEQLALGLIDREHATVVAARRRNTLTQDQRSEYLLPSYTDSIGILG
ncbi:hypothetical protein BCV70DRAFT_228713 [Testicularia cyperi]|uniref:Uncharacterized protein n=1 Tax=Testicularia cyperi TaxID=1882483 RepID=A0A317XFK7_9BASI|nr:hypothetical protein BCV70DRAFT_228713 [Testicularia cyperi]